MSFAIKLNLLLILVPNIVSMELCDLREDVCEKYNNYSFTELVKDTYDFVMEYIGIEHSETEITQEYGETGEDEFIEITAGDEKMVDAFMQQAKDIAAFMEKDTYETDLTGLADIMAEFMGVAEESDAVSDSEFEYLPVRKLEPGEVGEERILKLPYGREVTIRTLAKQPVLLEIDNFLSDEECDQIVKAAKKKSLVKSAVFVALKDRINGNDRSEVRNSKSATLEPPEIDTNLLQSIRERISTITEIPMYVIEASEPLSIGQYDSGGFYHAHLDSNEASRKAKPCCFQKPCIGEDGNIYEGSDCCTMCRYATFLYYLSDVEQGGETAFPFADMKMSAIMSEQTMVKNWDNLTENCHKSAVVVKPKKGKAIFWYNHYLDNKGYISGVDKRGHHGGCNVKEGTKWIATNWISFPIYAHRHIQSRYGNMNESYKRHIESLQQQQASV